MKQTNEGFDESAWHDCKVHGFAICQDNLESKVVFDIDFIEEWVVESGCQFRVAPVSLIFKDVTDLKLIVDWGDSGYKKSEDGPFISKIIRSPVETPLRVDSYFRWELIDSDDVVFASFGASSYDQITRKESILTSNQYLLGEERD